MEWDYIVACSSKFILPAIAFIIFFEYIIRRANKRNQNTYDEYLKKAEELNEKTLKKSLDNQVEMIAILKEIRDSLKK